MVGILRSALCILRVMLVTWRRTVLESSVCKSLTVGQRGVESSSECAMVVLLYCSHCIEYRVCTCSVPTHEYTEYLTWMEIRQARLRARLQRADGDDCPRPWLEGGLEGCISKGAACTVPFHIVFRAITHAYLLRSYSLYPVLGAVMPSTRSTTTC